MTSPITQIPSFSMPPISAVDQSNIPALQKAMELQPKLAAQAMSQASGMGTSPVMSLNSAKALNSLTGPKVHTDAELKQVSQNFESIFIQMMLKEMRNSVEKSSLFGNSQATQFFESMKDEEMSKQLSTSGGIGLGNVIYQQLKRATESHIKTFS
ncbi:MAG TPA: rod-binding protein [bacterium]|jgi:flagellar protein FlgJ|nr:rod-binding protein [bacterium]